LLQLELACLDLREVENVIDEGEQGVRVLEDVFRVVALYRIEWRVEEQLFMPMTPFIGVRIS